jgi:hypothetical protein
MGSRNGGNGSRSGLRVSFWLCRRVETPLCLPGFGAIGGFVVLAGVCASPGDIGSLEASGRDSEAMRIDSNLSPLVTT